jgi:hypothetical protein
MARKSKRKKVTNDTKSKDKKEEKTKKDSHDGSGLEFSQLTISYSISIKATK